MQETFRVAYVLGVTPGKWAGVWRERMPRHPIELLQASPTEAVAALDSGVAHVALVRLPIEDERLPATTPSAIPFYSIPLYFEKAVVVVPKGHHIEELDEVTLAELTAPLDGDWVEAVALVAANAGVVVLPQSVARALSRKDVVARPVTDAPHTRVALVWRNTTPEVDEFIGIVRGRTVNSSRGQPSSEQLSHPPSAKAPSGGRKPKPVQKKKRRR